MPKKPKLGLDYAGWDVHIFDDDERMDQLIDSQGWQGFSVYFFICQKAYATGGYYLNWSEASPASIARRMGGGIRSGTITQVVALCLRIGLFDKRLFDRERVLTSNEIQERFMYAVEKRGESGRTVNPVYWLLNSQETKSYIVIPETGHYLPNSGSNTPENSTKQSKAKESKVKQSKAEQSIDAHMHAIADADVGYRKIDNAYFSVTGKHLVENDKMAISRLSGKGISIDAIAEKIHVIGQRGRQKINSFNYFVSAIMGELESQNVAYQNVAYPSTFNTQDVETILNAEWEACPIGEDEDYIYDD